MKNMIDQFISEKLTGLIVFEMEEKEFCADIKDISAILNPQELKTEESDIYSLSSIKLNEIDVPIIDLHKFLGVQFNKDSKDIRVMLVETDERLFGFIVERVKEIFTMNKEFRSKLNFIPGEGKFIIGRINYEGRELLLPDFKKIIESNKI